MVDDVLSVSGATRGLFFAFVSLPLLILLHELGHAVAGLMVTRHPVSVVLGSREKGAWHGRFRRLELWIEPFSWIYGHSHVQHDEHAPAWQRAFVIVAGPLITLLALIGLAVVVASGPEPGWLEKSVNAATFHTVVQLLATIVPWRRPRWMGSYAGSASDGLRLIRLWRR